jgi:hypothetical protein
MRTAGFAAGDSRVQVIRTVRINSPPHVRQFHHQLKTRWPNDFYLGGEAFCNRMQALVDERPRS